MRLAALLLAGSFLTPIGCASPTDEDAGQASGAQLGGGASASPDVRIVAVGERLPSTTRPGTECVVEGAIAVVSGAPADAALNFALAPRELDEIRAGRCSTPFAVRTTPTVTLNAHGILTVETRITFTREGVTESQNVARSYFVEDGRAVVSSSVFDRVALGTLFPSALTRRGGPYADVAKQYGDDLALEADYVGFAIRPDGLLFDFGTYVKSTNAPLAAALLGRPLLLTWSELESALLPESPARALWAR